ncbi:MAG: hypothetical protein LUC18_04845 [Porphyromonadaceae bacterium]|nr:hypothetical protein [Porphyromonadaceae bacterium]
MTTTILKEVITFLLGRKYYGATFCLRGVSEYQFNSVIYTSKEAMLLHKQEMDDNRTYKWIETFSFRSRKDYPLGPCVWDTRLVRQHCQA